MRKLLKVLLPPFIGIALYFIAVRYSGQYFTLKIEDIGGGKLHSFMAYYRYIMPLALAIAILTQLLIAVPIWNRAMRYQTTIAKVADFIGLCFLCLLFAMALAYPISDVEHNLKHFEKVVLFMTGVQLGYWVINLLLLYLIDHSAVKPPTDAGAQLVDE